MKLNFIKSLLLILIFSFFTSSVFSKELNSRDLAALHSVLDARYYAGDYETSAEKIAYLLQKEQELKSIQDELSEEVKLICKSIFTLEKEIAKASEFQKVSGNSEKKQDKKSKNNETEKIILDCYRELKDYSETHTYLSSHFYYHFKEAEFSAMAYFSTNEQLRILKGILDDYRKIEEMNPEFSENHFMLGTLLFFMPKIAGGNKTESKEQLLLAIKHAACNYEKASSLIMLSQILYDDKNYDEAFEYLNAAYEIDPKNKSVQKIKEANAAGYSMFEMNKYLKK